MDDLVILQKSNSLQLSEAAVEGGFCVGGDYMSSMPEGWQDPKTNWSPEDPVGPGDLTRIERNAQAIELGDRTLDAAQAPTGNTGTLRQILSWIVNRIKAITGGANWWSTPATTLAGAKAHMDANMAAGTVHGVKAGTAANNMLRLDSSGKVPSSVMPGAGLFYFASDAPYSGEALAKRSSDSDDQQWLTVGPTGSGADVIWAALDAVPQNARAVRLNLRVDADVGFDLNKAQWFILCVRKTGSTVTPAAAIAGSVLLQGESPVFLNSVGVQLNNRKFDIWWRKSEDLDAHFDLYIILEGWYA